MKHEDTIKQIDLYIRGKLTDDEIRTLWIEIMQDPELLNYIETEAGLHHLFNSEQSGTVDEPDKSYSTSKKWSSLLILILISTVPFFS